DARRHTVDILRGIRLHHLALAPLVLTAVVVALGAEDWPFRRRVWMGLKFGLVHLVMGIPIGVALALSIGGWYFQWSYLRAFRRSAGDVRAALMESTRSHLAYNMEVLSVALVALVVSGSLS